MRSGLLFSIPWMIAATLLSTLLFSGPNAAAEPNTSAPKTERETTDVYIRRLAGLPASSAVGDVEIIDVGHHALDTMLSIVARHSDQGWHVSYACSSSPHCSTGKDYASEDYDLSVDANRQVDAILAHLKSDPELNDPQPELPIACGHLTVAIDYQGLKKTYQRACVWGPTLSSLEKLLKPGPG